jgi:hypothetical protein
MHFAPPSQLLKHGSAGRQYADLGSTVFMCVSWSSQTKQTSGMPTPSQFEEFRENQLAL